MSRKKSKSPRKPALPASPSWFLWWQRQTESVQHLIAAAVLIAVSFGFFAPIHFSARQLISGDTVQWISMANAMISFEQQVGEPALWSPNTYGGMPGYMVYYPDAVPQIDAVFSALRSFMWPSSHFLLLLFGMYLFTWYLTKDKLSGLFSAIAFGLTTYIPVLMTAGHNTKFVALAWAPWLLLAFVYVLRQPSLKAGLLFALAMAMNLRADHVQITYYVLFVIGIWWIVEAIFAHKNGESNSFWRSTSWLALGAVLALFMVAQPYLSQFEYKRFSIRGSSSGGTPGGLTWEYAMAWSQGIGELFTLIVADAFGGGTQYYWGPKSFTAGPHYLGAITIVLSLLLLVQKRDAATWALGLSAGLAILFALGENFPLLNHLMFDYFPLFSAFRVPETWLVTVAMVTSVLAGRSLAELLKDSESKTWKKPAFLTFGIVTGILVILLVAPDSVFSFEKPAERAILFQQIQVQNPGISEADPRVQQAIGEEINRRKIERKELFEGDAQRSVVFLLLGLLVLFLYFRGSVPGWLSGFAFVMLILLDLGGVGRRYIRDEILTPAKEASSEVPRTAFDDFILDKIDEAGGSGHLRVLSLESGRDPNVNARPSFHYESLGGYHAAKLRVYQDFLDHILFDPSSGALNPNALSMMNVKYIVGRRAVPGYEMAFQDDASGNSVFENPDVLPRAFFVGRAEVIENPETMWARLRSPDFDPSESVLLSRETDLDSTPIDSTSIATADLISHSPRRIDFELESDADRWLVISEVYYPPGWKAFIDDSIVPIEQGDYLLRAVYVPRGSHRLSMRFDPSSHTWGVGLSAASALLVYGGLLLILIPGWLRRRTAVPGE